jgi:hypothetical protein
MGVLTALVASCTVACSAEPSGGTADNAPPAQVLAANGTEAVEQLSGEQARAAVETSAIQDVDVESTLESSTSTRLEPLPPGRSWSIGTSIPMLRSTA